MKPIIRIAKYLEVAKPTEEKSNQSEWSVLVKFLLIIIIHIFISSNFLHISKMFVTDFRILNIFSANWWPNKEKKNLYYKIFASEFMLAIWYKIISHISLLNIRNQSPNRIIHIEIVLIYSLGDLCGLNLKWKKRKENNYG